MKNHYRKFKDEACLILSGRHNIQIFYLQNAVWSIQAFILLQSDSYNLIFCLNFIISQQLIIFISTLSMGQTNSKKNQPLNQWTYVDTLGRFQIYRNQHNQLAQKHTVKVDPKIQESDYLAAYHQRYLPNKPIVNAYDAEFKNKTKAMCQNASTITVFTQYIPHRLSDVQTLNHGQGMYVLSQALAGFSQLYNKVGPFQVNQDLIGFNQQGQVRVWHNPNFAENSVDNDRIILMSTLNPYDFDRKFSQNQEHDMVEDTLNSIARYTQFHPAFLQQAQQLKKLNFSQARSVIAGQINRKAYYVPDHLFLGDKNSIIQKSGISIKNKHVYNPNKPRKGQKYPYFYNQNQNQNGNGHYYQGQTNQGQYGYDDYSSSSDSTSTYQQGGFYNLNGQNYRVISTKQVSGNNHNQQAIIQEALRNQGHNYGQTIQNSNQHYTQGRSVYNNDQYYPSYNDTDSSSQYSQNRYVHTQSNINPSNINPQISFVKPNHLGSSINAQQNYQRPQHYQEGHIVISDGSQILRQNQNGGTYNDPYYNSGQNFQRNNQQSLRFTGGSAYNPQQYRQQQSGVQTNYPYSSYLDGGHISQQNVSNVYPGNYSQNHDSHHYGASSGVFPEKIGHRNKIFQEYSPRQPTMTRQEPRLIQQRVI